MPDVQLITDGQRYGGWQSIRIERAIDQLAGSFELKVTDRWPDQFKPRAIRSSHTCRLEVDGEVVITGWIDEVSPSYDVDAHRISVQGRDKTGELVDNSVVHEPGDWENRTLTQIAEDLVEPYGIEVRADTDVGEPFEKFKAESGETVFEALERAARHRGVLLTSDGRGTLVITRPGTDRVDTVLERGKNILSAGARFSHQERFRDYIVRVQKETSDFASPEETTQAQATATDEGVPEERPRTLVLMAEEPSDAEHLESRAKWERNVRIGRGVEATVTVQGWRHRDGLWIPNTLVKVRDRWLDLDGRELLIARVAHVLDDRGTRTELTLSLPAAFTVLEVPEPEEGDGWG